MTVLTPSQCKQAFAHRARLLEILGMPDIGRPLSDAQMEFVHAHKDLLRGSSSQWDMLVASKVSFLMPTKSHVFVEAAMEPVPIVMGRLLLDCKMDAEAEVDFEMEGSAYGWSLWRWLSSIVLDDGVPDSQLMQSGWEVLLPLMLASGFDMDRPCAIHSAAHLSRWEWLKKQDVTRLEAARVAAQGIILSRNTGASTCNSASRRI